jgi:hypothetical protein
MRKATTAGLLAALLAAFAVGGCESDNDDRSDRGRLDNRNRPARASENFSDRDRDGIRDGLEDRNRNGVKDGNENGGANRRDPDRYR